MQLTATVAQPEQRDEAIVMRAASGDREAFATLIAPRADRALRLARAILGNEAEAHDAAQEAMVAAWVNLPRLREPSRFDAWLHRLLVNACRETLRRRRRSREVSTEIEADVAAGDFAGTSLDTASVKSAFNRLSLDQRTTLLLHHLHGMPLDQVARHLDVPVGTAKSRLFHARRALERALEAEA
jgi:RNA polymerase sigma-70 factor (ECF subfamily)